MGTTRLSSKGQVIIPKAIRAAHGWEAGMELAVEEGADGAVLLRPLNTAPAVRATELLGCTGYRGPRRSLADMKAAVETEARKHR